MKQPFLFPRQAGFTLLEVLIATVLLSIMMALLLGGMRIGADSWEQGERVSERGTRLLVTENFLRAHLTNLKPLFEQQTKNGAFAGMPKLVFKGQEDLLEYAGILPPQVKGGLYIFTLHHETEGERSDLKLSLRPFSSDMEGQDAEVIEDVLVLEELESLKITYLKRTPGSDQVQWMEDWTDNVLPSLIRLDIRLRGEPPWPSIYVAPKAETGQ